MTKQTESMSKHQESDAATTGGHALPEEHVVTPEADIYETPDGYVVSLDIPGAAKHSITVTVEKGNLNVMASVQPVHSEQASLVYREIRTTGYQRAFTLGEGIDTENIDARYSEGVLTVKLFKSEESKPREITIH